VPDSRALDGETPLHIAAQEGRAQEIRLLVEAGADVGATDEDGETPLHTAVQHIGSKSLDHLSALLECRADVGAKNFSGESPMSQAPLYTNRGSELQDLLGKAQRQSQRQTEDSGSSASSEMSMALRTACKRGQADCVKMLLEMGPDPKAAATGAMIAAAAGGSIPVVEMLLAARADLNAEDQASGTLPLVAAAEESKVKLVRWMLSARADPCKASKDGATALMAASLRGSTEEVSLLLESRSDVNHQAYGSWTALMVACQKGNLGVCRQLFDAHADLSMRNSDGVTSRDLAMGNAHNELVRYLDTWSKLNARRSRGSGRGGVVDAVEGSAEKTPDPRDLDALLEDLEGPTAATKKAKKKTQKVRTATDQFKDTGIEQRSSAVAGSRVATGAAQAARQTPEAPERPAALNPEPREEGSTPAGQVKPSAPSARSPRPEAAEGGTSAARRDALTSPDSPSGRPDASRLRSLRQRLREVERRRADLNREEAELRGQLAKLLGYGSGDSE